MADVTSSRNSYVSSKRMRAGVSKGALYTWLSWLVPLWSWCFGRLRRAWTDCASGAPGTKQCRRNRVGSGQRMGIFSFTSASRFCVPWRASYRRSDRPRAWHHWSASRRWRRRFSTVRSRWCARSLSLRCCRSSSSGSAWARLRKFFWSRSRSCSPSTSTPCSASARSIRS